LTDAEPGNAPGAPPEPEREYAAIIDALRRVIVTLCGGPSNTAILGSADSFLDLARDGDIGQLRKRMEHELAGLQLAMESKRKERDELITVLADRLALVQNKLFHTQDRLKRTENETTRDALTAIANRGHFDRQIEMWMASRRRARPFVLAMIDVDNFKHVNDSYGHQTGDRVLVAVSEVMRRMIRSNDLVARYGGEEFAILFGNMSLERARERSLQILDAVRMLSIEIPGGSLSVTLSCGLAMSEPGDTPRTLVKRADAALYDAKAQGRNRVEIGACR
jgi:diguanylate cyclase